MWQAELEGLSGELFFPKCRDAAALRRRFPSIVLHLDSLVEELFVPWEAKFGLVTQFSSSSGASLNNLFHSPIKISDHTVS